MLSLKFIRQNLELVKNGLAAKMEKVDLDTLLSSDFKVRELKNIVEGLRAKRNKQSNEIAELKRKNLDVQEKIVEVRELAKEIKRREGTLHQIEKDEEVLLSTIANLPHNSVPLGKGPDDNKIIRQWGEPQQFSFSPKTHLQLGKDLDILDFKRAAKLSGSNFPLFKGKGALLERALINFFLNLHTQNGYQEISPPLLVNRRSMFNTGQFAYSPCFRREAGSYGKETKGLIRVHQFDKVELVKFVSQESSYDELEFLLRDAENVLQKLELPYRVVLLCTGELSFASAKCYDIEVFAPASNLWLEVSTCANFEDFQTRRANIKYRRPTNQFANQQTKYVHTLNGSGIALARTMVAILENYQQEDGSIKIPSVLEKYINEEKIKK